MCLESLRTTLALAVIHDLDVTQFDITSVYLRRNLKEVYMKHPEGYITPEKVNWVWHLKRGPYGLAQAYITRKEELHACMEREEFMATPKGPAVYVRNTWTCHDFVEGTY